MKFYIMFKTPDALSDLTLHNHGLSVDEIPLAREFAEKFVQYGEYIRVEFDTEAKTATARRNA